jgi:hypothetical protein
MRAGLRAIPQPDPEERLVPDAIPGEILVIQVESLDPKRFERLIIKRWAPPQIGHADRDVIQHHAAFTAPYITRIFFLSSLPTEVFSSDSANTTWSGTA